MSRLVTLAECPPGPFRFGDILGFKTEYGATRSVGPVDIPGDQVRFTVSHWPDAYVMESGEAFWGGETTDEKRAALLVEPVEVCVRKPTIYDQQIINWLEGIRDHTDNDVEHDLLGSLIQSIEEREHIDEPVVNDPNWTPPPGEDPPF